MCIYGEYGICSLCPQEECPEKEKIINISVSQQIKKYQAEAEEQHHNLELEFLNKWTELLGCWTNISYTYDEVKKITDYLRQHKESVIKEINEL